MKDWLMVFLVAVGVFFAVIEPFLKVLLYPETVTNADLYVD